MALTELEVDISQSHGRTGGTARCHVWVSGVAMLLHTGNPAERPVEQWTAIGASVTGTGHVARQVPCQDAHGGLVLADGSLLLVVADGAGSVRYSTAGAEYAVQTALHSVANALAHKAPTDEGGWRGLLMHALSEAQARLREVAEGTAGSHPSEFAATLLMMAIAPEHIASLQVGDGAMVLRSTDSLRVLPTPATAEYINRTTFITSVDANANALISVEVNRAIDDFAALFTDGVQFLAIELSSNTAHARFFDPVFRFGQSIDANPAEIERMLSSERATT